MPLALAACAAILTGAEGAAQETSPGAFDFPAFIAPLEPEGSAPRDSTATASLDTPATASPETPATASPEIAATASVDDSATAPPDTTADGDDAIFYLGVPYGSDAYMGPLDVVLNKGYAVAQFNNRNRYIFDYDYGARHVWNSVTQPVENVRRYGGWEKLVREELLPLSFSWRKWKWAPNYFGHVVEGGITYRRLAEWNEARGVPLPAVTAAVVTMGSAVINEMYAHPGYVEGTTATMADLLFFDPLGIALFAHEGVARFFAERLNGQIWSSQAALTPDGELVNNGNNVIFKVPLPGISSTSAFVRGGLAFTPGLTFHREDGLDVSVAFGAEGRIQEVDPGTGEETPELALGGGVFVDRGGSLLVSVMASEVEHRRFVVNVYPGVIPFAGGRFGAWLLVRENGTVRFGLSARGALGLGIAGGFGG